MFQNLRAEMARNGLSAKQVSFMIGIAPDSMKNKLSGATEFKLGEMQRIQSIFRGCTLDYLFEKGGDDEVQVERVSC